SGEVPPEETYDMDIVPPVTSRTIQAWEGAGVRLRVTKCDVDLPLDAETFQRMFDLFFQAKGLPYSPDQLNGQLLAQSRCAGAASVKFEAWLTSGQMTEPQVRLAEQARTASLNNWEQMGPAGVEDVLLHVRRIALGSGQSVVGKPSDQNIDTDDAG